MCSEEGNRFLRRLGVKRNEAKDRGDPVAAKGKEYRIDKGERPNSTKDRQRDQAVI